MKLLLLISALSFSQAAVNKNSLPPSKATVIAVTSAQLIKYKFEVANPAKKMLRWHYKLQIKRLQEELAYLVTH